MGLPDPADVQSSWSLSCRVCRIEENHREERPGVVPLAAELDDLNLHRLAVVAAMLVLLRFLGMVVGSGLVRRPLHVVPCQDVPSVGAGQTNPLAVEDVGPSLF